MEAVTKTNRNYTEKEVQKMVLESFNRTEQLLYEKIRDHPEQRALNLAKLDALKEVTAEIVSALGIWKDG